MVDRTVAAAVVLMNYQLKYSRWVRHGPGSSSDSSLASSAFPDANGSSSDGILATEIASVSGSLCDQNFLNLLSQASTISGTESSSDSCLLGSLRLYRISKVNT
jgi:hypothetical protein